MKKVKKIVKDFTIADLPVNRKELFFDILKTQWNSLLIIAFIMMLSFLPFIIYRYYNLLTINNIIVKKEETMLLQIKQAYFIYNSFNILTILFVGIVFSGLSRLYKKLAFNEGFFLIADFFKGIKENIKDFLILFLIYGIINFILESLAINYLISNSFLCYVFKIINYLIFIPILFICVCMSAIYNDSIFKKVSLSFIIYFKYLPKVILVSIICVLPLFLLLIPTTTIQLLLPIFYCLIYLPISYLLFVIVMNSIFDDEINKKSFPSLVKKGMYNKN